MHRILIISLLVSSRCSGVTGCDPLCNVMKLMYNKRVQQTPFLLINGSLLITDVPALSCW